MEPMGEIRMLSVKVKEHDGASKQVVIKTRHGEITLTVGEYDSDGVPSLNIHCKCQENWHPIIAFVDATGDYDISIDNYQNRQMFITYTL
jgi:predicted lipoprotein with Yx(FWY)xxD motif